MSIESLGLNRPGGPMRPQRTERRERREAVVPRGKSFDAAEVRGGKPPVRQGTEEVLGKLHERGLLTNVSRPLGPDGQPIQSDGRGYGRAYGGTDAAAQTEQAEIPEHYRQRIHEAVVKFGEREFGKAQQPEEPMLEGRVYGRPRPQPPQPAEGARRDSGVFTIKLYSPAVDTGKTLRIGDHVIPLEEDGSILAGMPDGTVRRITFDQDVMDEMVARGEVWMEGDEPKAPHAAETATEAIQTERHDTSVLAHAHDLFRRQSMYSAQLSGWEPGSKMTSEQQSAHRQIEGKGYWSVQKSAERIIGLARSAAGNDPTYAEKLRAEFIQARKDVEAELGGNICAISEETYVETMKLFDEWAAEAKTNDNAGKDAPTLAFQTAQSDAAQTAEKTDDTKKTNSTADTYGPQSKGNPALVEQLKADLERRQQQMLDMVRDMLSKQGKNVSGDNIWRTLAGGNFQVDAKTKAEAQKNIAEDGFWGVEQTSDRIVQFAIALAGSSPEMLDKMEAAFEKGYAEAEKKWGGALQSISQQTRSRVHEKFEELRKQTKNSATASAQSKEETV